MLRALLKAPPHDEPAAGEEPLAVQEAREELARVLKLHYDTLLELAGTADIVVQEYREALPRHTDTVISLFRTAQQQEFHDWDHLCQIVACRRRAGS
jgi:hypothetical protein